MTNYGQFPQKRMRRLRHDEFSRRLMRENCLLADDLIYPVFVLNGKNREEKIPSMPEITRLSADKLMRQAEKFAGQNSGLFLFSTLDKISDGNILTSPIWQKVGESQPRSILGKQAD